MSAHKDPKYQTPELIAALRAHGLETNKPSQLSDAFRFGWAEARRFPPVEPAVSDAVLKLSELMRGLELSPASVNLAPGQLYLIGEAICRQAKYALPPATLGAETIADHLFIEERSVGIWLVCVEKVHATEEDAQTACKAWKLKVTGTTAPIDMVLHCP